MLKIFLTAIIFFILGCDNSYENRVGDESEAVLNNDQSKQPVVVVDPCLSAPDYAVLSKDLPDELKALISFDCYSDMGHRITAQKSYFWLYSIKSFDGFSVPDAASISSNSLGELVHDDSKKYFKSVELEILDENEYELILGRVNDSLGENKMSKRAEAKRIKIVGGDDVTQYIYLFSGSQGNTIKDTVGFSCNPNCNYDKIFTLTKWHFQ